MSAFDDFLAAIRNQESGGSYKVVNSSSGALGAYQVMPSNLPNWSKAALGHVDSVSEYLAHPADQDAVARYELGPVYDKHGPAGAAAWWYSGQTDPTKTYGHPPVYKYVESVLAQIGHVGSVTPADNVSGSTVTTAGLQQAGYEPVINLTPWGMPLNPFKIPGWVAGKSADGAGEALGALGSTMWDTIGPMILSSLGVLLGGGIVLIGLYVTTKPTIEEKTDQAAQAAQAVPAAAAL